MTRCSLRVGDDDAISVGQSAMPAAPPDAAVRHRSRGRQFLAASAFWLSLKYAGTGLPRGFETR